MKISLQQGLEVPGLVIDWDTVDGITKANLKDTYDSLVNINQALSKIKKLASYQQEDLNYNINMQNHIKAVLDYFGVNV
jgi:hypothetical protein